MHLALQILILDFPEQEQKRLDVCRVGGWMCSQIYLQVEIQDFIEVTLHFNVIFKIIKRESFALGKEKKVMGPQQSFPQDTISPQDEVQKMNGNNLDLCTYLLRVATLLIFGYR